MLVARVIKLITDRESPVDIDKFLIVTFTNAAAAENEIQNFRRLAGKKLRTSPGDPLIMRQLSLLPGAQICTIDSFCLDLVRENFFSIGISRDFTILQNSEENILSESALNSVLDELFEESDPDFISLVQMLCPPKKTIKRLSQQLRRFIHILTLRLIRLSGLKKCRRAI
ncbi:MAG: UvrD-helicase domain-containing protein [Anaerotruncus sp.]|nr:MAG: UvrD-helicase domain-containing protein [Anaerotruncus sp.]